MPKFSVSVYQKVTPRPCVIAEKEKRVRPETSWATFAPALKSLILNNGRLARNDSWKLRKLGASRYDQGPDMNGGNIIYCPSRIEKTGVISLRISGSLQNVPIPE